MSDSLERRERPSGKALFLIAFLVALAALFAAAWHPWFDATPDGSMYLLTARSVAAGTGYATNGEPFRLRPPLFSLVLAGLDSWGASFGVLNAFVLTTAALAGAALCALARPRIGALAAAAVAGALLANPDFQRLATQSMSDVPGLAALFALALASRAPQKPWLLGLAVGATALLRTNALLWLPALALAQLAGATKRAQDGASASGPLGWRRFTPVVLGAVLVWSPWAVRNASLEEVPSEQARYHSYATALLHTDQGDPASPRVPLAELAARVGERGPEILAILGSRLASQEVRGAGDALFGAAILGALLLQAWRRRAPEAFFCLALLAVSSISFGLSPRHLLPVYAFGLAALAEALATPLARLGRAGAPILALSFLALGAWDCAPRRDWAEIEARHERTRRQARGLREALPEGARLASTRGWEHAVFLRRPVFNLAFAVERAGSPRAAEELIDRYRLDTVLTGAERASDQDLRRYLEARYPSQRVAGVHLFRVRERAILPSD